MKTLNEFLNENKNNPEDYISDGSDKRKYIALRKSAQKFSAASRKGTPVKKQHNELMAQQALEQAADILAKYTDLQ